MDSQMKGPGGEKSDGQPDGQPTMQVGAERTWTDRQALKLADFVIRWRWLVLLATIVVVGIAASGMRHLEFSNNYRVFFGPENPDLMAFEDFQNTYTKNDNILFVIQPKEGSVFTPEMAATLEDLTKKAWTIPYAIRVDSITNFQHTWANGDDLTVEDLIRKGDQLPPGALAEKRQIALGEPLLRDNLIAPDTRTTGINVTLQYPEKSLTEVPEAMALARKIAADAEAAVPGLTIALTGMSPMNAAFAESSATDGATLYPLMFGVLIVVTFLIVRSFGGTFATVMLITLATVTALGVAGHAGITLNPVSSSAPVVILTLAIADSIHILISMLGLMREGQDKRTALRESVRINLLAVTITSVTTIIGFLALNFSDAPPYHDLGNISAAGIAAAWILSLTFLPAAMAILPIRVKTGRGIDQRVDGMISAFAKFVIAKSKAILVVSAFATVGLAAYIPTINLNDEWVKYFDHRIPFRGDAEFALDNLTGLYLLEYSVPGDGAGGISEPEFLEHLDKFTAWLREQPETVHVYSYTDIIKRLNKNLHGDDPAHYKLPDNRELAAQYLLLYELSLPFGLDLNDRVSVDKGATRVTATLLPIPTVETREFIDRSKAWFEENAPSYMRTTPTGPTVMFSYISERNIREMMVGNLIAILLIAGIMVLALRNLSLGMLSLIPNALPIVMTFGVWALIQGQVGMAAAVVSATSLGIIVDNTVHFLTKYLRARRERSFARPEAIHYAFRTVGLAILANAVILALGFAVLALSSFKITSEMGSLTALAVVIALIVDFILLPALLLIGYGKKQGTRHDDTPDQAPLAATT